MIPRIPKLLGSIVLTLVILACGGITTDPATDGLGTGGTDTTGTGGGGGGGDTTTTPTPTFAADVQTLFDAEGCNASNCHGATAGPGNGNLDLRAGTSYSQLVNVIARGENIIRVAPGDPNASYLVIKLEGNQSSGSRMPRGQPALSSAKIQLIRDWITAGAEND